jgi:acyl transferase domain-containing protein
MTDHETQLAKSVQLNCELLLQLTRITANVLARAVELGAFDERAAVVRHDCEQLLSELQALAPKQAAFRAQFEKP